MFLRPKAFVNSSGTTWANETVRLRHTLPYAFEVKGSRQIGDQTSDFITALCQLKDTIFYFDDMTLNAHALQKMFFKATMRAQTEYEQERLDHTHNRINKILEEVELSRA